MPIGSGFIQHARPSLATEVTRIVEICVGVVGMINGEASARNRQAERAGDEHVSPDVKEVLNMLQALEQRNRIETSSSVKSSRSKG